MEQEDWETWPLHQLSTVMGLPQPFTKDLLCTRYLAGYYTHFIIILEIL